MALTDFQIAHALVFALVPAFLALNLGTALYK